MFKEILVSVIENGIGVVAATVIMFLFINAVKDIFAQNSKIQEVQIETLKKIGSSQESIKTDITLLKKDVENLKEGQKEILRTQLRDNEVFQELIYQVKSSSEQNLEMVKKNMEIIDENIKIINEMIEKRKGEKNEE